ncbi:MAG: glyoxalase [Flavobacteriaceae bacterium]
MNSIKDATFHSLRAFIGAKNYALSKEFYTDLGFEIIEIDSQMCLIQVKDNLCFYLQNAYVKDWINNSMLFLEVEDLDKYYQWILDKKLPNKFKTVRITEIRDEHWGREFFMHDPSGVLWHFGNFNKL